MKIVVAMDSFKGSLTTEQACEAVAKGLSSVCPGIEVVSKLLADGGEGTACAMLAARPGKWVCKEVIGPLPEMTVQAGYAWFDKDRTALVEMAAASGLELLTEAQRNPLRTTTYGTGQLIKAAAQAKPAKILLAIGGSATVDGGVGAAMALGWRFLDEKALSIAYGGGELRRICTIVPPERLILPPVEVLCDVVNPLCGENGAARIFGPQKGASPGMVEELEKGLRHFAELVNKQLGKEIDVARAGAAGGLSAGAVAFMNARLVSGIETIIEYSRLSEAMHGADWVITGEGRFDRQSLCGKAVSGVVKAARQAGVPAAVLAGSVALPRAEYEGFGVAAAVAAMKSGMSLDYAIAHGDELLSEAAAKFAREHLGPSHCF